MARCSHEWVTIWPYPDIEWCLHCGTVRTHYPTRTEWRYVGGRIREVKVKPRRSDDE